MAQNVTKGPLQICEQVLTDCTSNVLAQCANASEHYDDDSHGKGGASMQTVTKCRSTHYYDRQLPNGGASLRSLCCMHRAFDTGVILTHCHRVIALSGLSWAR